eukprot:g2462.t1
MKSDAANPTHHSGITSGVVKRSTQPDCDPSGQRCVTFVSSSTDDAARAAANADVAIVFAAANSGEGSDRADLNLGNAGNALISAAAHANPNTVAVVVTPGALLTDWAPGVNSAVASFMPGQEYGHAVADILFGSVNPSARLPVTFPNIENEVNFSSAQWPGVDGRSEYSEELLVGYRYYHAHNVAPRFGFGHGLSYTTFAYRNIVTSKSAISCELENTGNLSGAEIAQLYLTFPISAEEPPMQLKGFVKTYLKPGESANVTFSLNDRSFSIWNTDRHDWAIVNGDFDIFVGASSTDIRLKSTLSI